MKTIHEILIQVKTNYLRNIKFYGKTYGLCNACDHPDIMEEEYYLFRDYLRNDVKSRKVFYTSEGLKTPYTHQFVWKIENQEARIKWLNKHIKRNE